MVLKVRKWPNLDWLVACIEGTVEKKLGGWGEAAAPKLEKKPRCALAGEIGWKTLFVGQAVRL